MEADIDILKFMNSYGKEESCMEKFKEIRQKAGISCKKCTGTEHYWLSGKQMWQCKGCRFRTSLRSGTVMEYSKLPFRYWFVAIWLTGCSKKGSSACNIQRQLGHKRYEPIWAMMHKIRSAMGIRDAKYLLSGDVELDEGFFETVVPEEQKEEKRKRGRGSQKQTMAMVFAQTEFGEPSKKHRVPTKCKYFKMVVCRDFSSQTAKEAIEENTKKGTKFITDGYSTYKSLGKTMEIESEKTPSKEAHIKLPWVHTAIGNAKKVLKGIHQQTKPEYLQNYLDEFCYKLNRRYFGNDIFDRILIACTLT